MKKKILCVAVIALLVTACAGKEGISQAPSDSVSIYETSSSVAATEKESLSSAPTLTPPDNIYYINENISAKIGDRLEELYKGDKVTTYEYETYEYMGAFSKPVQTKELSRIMNENEIIDIIWNVGILNTDNHISRIAINGKEMTYLYEKEEIKSAMGYVWKLRGFTYEGREYTFENEKNSSGAIFMDFLNRKDYSDFNTIIYGHNMRNGTMFGSLKKLLNDQEIIEENPYFYIFTEDKAYMYEIFAVYITTADSKTYNLIETEQEQSEYLDFIDQKATYRSDKEVTATDKIATLSTCHGLHSNNRTIVHGVLIAEEDR